MPVVSNQLDKCKSIDKGNPFHFNKYFHLIHFQLNCQSSREYIEIKINKHKICYALTQLIQGV